MPNGDVIDARSTFFSIRSKFKDDPAGARCKAYLDGGEAPSFVLSSLLGRSRSRAGLRDVRWLFP